MAGRSVRWISAVRIAEAVKPTRPVPAPSSSMRGREEEVDSGAGSPLSLEAHAQDWSEQCVENNDGSRFARR